MKAQIEIDWKFPRPILEWFSTLETLTVSGHLPLPIGNLEDDLGNMWSRVY